MSDERTCPTCLAGEDHLHYPSKKQVLRAVEKVRAKALPPTLHNIADALAVGSIRPGDDVTGMLLRHYRIEV